MNARKDGRMRRWIQIGTLALIVGLAAWFWPAQGRLGSLAAGCPEVPHTPYFTTAYGTAQLNSAVAPAGTIVEAFSPRDDLVGCFEVTTAGYYGEMYIYGADPSSPPIPGMLDGEPVTFRLNGAEAVASPVLYWHDDHSTPHEVNLSASGETPTDTPTPTPTSSAPPDLIVQSIAATPAAPVVNEPISVTITIRNQSLGPANGLFYTDAYEDHRPTGCDDLGWHYVDTNDLAGNQSLTLVFPHPGFATTGVHQFYAQVDSGCQIVEGNETNNIGGPLRVTVKTAVAPAADFSATPRLGIAPLTVQFADLSTGDVRTWLWSFGDGATSSQQHPAHLYATPGLYPVSLAITGPAGGDTETKAGYIDVREGHRVYLPLVLRQY
jgi:hypothetical protein